MSTAPRDLRAFGFILAGGLAVIAALPFAPAFATGHRFGFWIAAAVIAALGAAVPRALAPVFAIWTRIGKVLGWVNTRVLLGLVFFVVVLPLGLLRRARLRQVLPQGADAQARSYRVARTPDADPARFDRPY